MKTCSMCKGMARLCSRCQGGVTHGPVYRQPAAFGWGVRMPSAAAVRGFAFGLLVGSFLTGSGVMAMHSFNASGRVSGTVTHFDYESGNYIYVDVEESITCSDAEMVSSSEIELGRCRF